MSDQAFGYLDPSVLGAPDLSGPLPGPSRCPSFLANVPFGGIQMLNASAQSATCEEAIILRPGTGEVRK